MREHVGRATAMGRRISGRVGHVGAPASSASDTLRGRAAPVTVLLLVLAVTVGAAVLVAGHHTLGDLLGSRPASASVPAAPLPATHVLALPPRKLTNGTRPLSVVLSAPVAAPSPPPTLRPAVAGTWAAVGNAEVFTPVSTLEPCSTY